MPSLSRLVGPSPRSKLLLAAIDLLMEDAELDPGAIETVLLTCGPGSFTGIRTGLATAAGLEAAVGARCVAYDSLQTQAARGRISGELWAAQPGRRGEVYARSYEVSPDRPPRSVGEIEVLSLAQLSVRSPWLAPESLDLGGATRQPAPLSAAEALFELHSLGAEPQRPEPLYVEGPPIHRRNDG